VDKYSLILSFGSLVAGAEFRGSSVLKGLAIEKNLKGCIVSIGWDREVAARRASLALDRTLART
jgi:hypothetical protein